MSSTTPHYNQDVPIHSQGPPGSKPYCIPEGGVMHVTASYPYNKLESNHQFRLLKLFPKSYEFPLVRLFDVPRSSFLYGILSDHDLEEEISYDCLSYVWGPPETNSVLWLDTYMVAISENLDMALRCLQHKTEPRMVWIDFVCINQDDHAERKQQVELMYKLYAKAEKVVAYLGNEADGSEKVPALLDQIERAHFKDTDEESQEKFIHPWREDDWTRLGLPTLNDPAWMCLRHFISRPWFIRVWIMQEALAAKHLVFICGLWMSPAPNIVQALKIACARRLPFTARLSEFKNHSMLPVARGVAHFNLLMELGLCEIICAKDDSWSLIDILERSRHASCTDPRDRVFALLNISNDKPPLGLQPDYTSTVPDTYKITARALVATGQGQRLLRNVWMSGAESNLQLPSWVPDWSLVDVPMDTISPLATRFKHEGYFEAGGTEQSIHLGENPDELVVQTFSIGNIHALDDVFEYEADPPPCPLDVDAPSSSENETTPASSTSEDDWSKYPVIFRVFGAITSYLTISSSPLYKNGDILDMSWRTMICDHELGKQTQAPQAFESYFRSYINHVSVMYGLVHPLEHVERIKTGILGSGLAHLIQSDEQLYTLIQQQGELQRQQAAGFEGAARKFCHSMRVCITNTGIVGMVPRFSEKRDVVVVVRGVNVPLVLRREGEDRFKVVGQAYFWGFMNGEIVDAEGMEEEEIVLI